MRIVLAVEELDGVHGGVERTIVNLANGLSGLGHDVTILTFEPESDAGPAYALDAAVRRSYLSLRPGNAAVRKNRNKREALKKRLPAWISETMRNALALRRAATARRREIPAMADALRQLDPGIVISFKTHFHRYAIPAARSLGIPVIASDHNPPSVLYYHYICAVDRWIIRHYLKQAAAIRVLLEDFREGYPRALRPRCIAIANGVDMPPHAVRPDKPLTILHVGRLYFQKDQATLVRAFATLAGRYPQWRVVIFGDGELEDELTALIAEFGLQDRILLKGPCADVWQAYGEAHIFALPSLFEGFGNVTLEAMASGLPVVAFDDSAANRHLICNGVDGVLVPTENRIQSFAAGLESLMMDSGLRVKLGAAARESVRRFDRRAILGQWDELIRDKAGT